MINFDALHKAKKTKFYIVKEAPNIKLWKVVPYDGSPYYAIIKTIDEDNSITIIKDKLRMAMRVFNKLQRSKNK
jgi:hypothetical protein